MKKAFSLGARSVFKTFGAIGTSYVAASLLPFPGPEFCLIQPRRLSFRAPQAKPRRQLRNCHVHHDGVAWCRSESYGWWRKGKHAGCGAAVSHASR